MVVLLVTPTQDVNHVKKEELLPQIVNVQITTSITVLLPVSNVTGNVSLVNILLITVYFVKVTESVPQIVIVTSTVVIMKSLNNNSVHLVTTDVILVLLMKSVSPVPLEELITPQLVIAQPTCMKTLPSSVLIVTTNVLNVTLMPILVPLVLISESMPQVVIAQMVLMMTKLKTQFVKLVLKFVPLVLVKLIV